MKFTTIILPLLATSVLAIPSPDADGNELVGRAAAPAPAPAPAPIIEARSPSPKSKSKPKGSSYSSSGGESAAVAGFGGSRLCMAEVVGLAAVAGLVLGFF
jgi:hypothetical protein